MCSLVIASAGSARAGSTVTFAHSVTRAIGSPSRSVVIADVTGDGRRDVIVSTGFSGNSATDGRLLVFPQTSSGLLDTSFAKRTDLSNGDEAGLATGDLNGDGRPDVALATGAGIDLFTQAATGGLAFAQLLPTGHIRQVEIAQVAGNARKDIVALTETKIFLFTNIGGSFARSVVASAHALEIEVGDVNGDGRTDVVDIHAGKVRVYPQLAGGGFGARVVYKADLGMFPGGAIDGFDVGDVSKGNGTDVVLDVGGYSPAMEVMPQVAGGALGAPVTYGSTYLQPAALESLDMNGDGRIDAANAYDGIGFVAVRLQQTNGLLGGELDFPVPYTAAYGPKAIALGDFSGDGKPDIALAPGDIGLVIVRQI